MSRNAKDWTKRFEPIAKALKELRGDAILDGEVVVTDSRGVTSFQALQQVMAKKAGDQLIYYVFDLLWLDGMDLRNAPLLERKRQLEALLARSVFTGDGQIRYSDHLRGNGEAFFQEACSNGL